MKIIAYGVYQAVAKKQTGIKLLLNEWASLAIFPEAETARDFVGTLLTRIRQEQGRGQRTADNLDPEVKLDFCIAKVIVDVDDEVLLKRGWQLPQTNGQPFEIRNP